MKKIITLAAFAATTGFSQAAVIVTGVQTDGTDAAYSADASNSDLVNAGTATLTGYTHSSPPFASAGAGAHNDGTVGAVDTLGDIVFWLGADGGSTYTITYTLNTTTNALGYDINSIQTINGWTGNSGFQKNQNYVVEVSAVGSATFSNIATVAYLPYTNAVNTASTKVNITEDATGVLASGVDQIRFTYTVQGLAGAAGDNPSPTIREIDVNGVATTVPEPSSTALLGLGGLALILRRRK